MIEKKTIANELAKQNKTEEELMKSLNIGAIAKRKRLELHLSQKEVSDEICSISYLSKIETNKIIPNSACLNLLMERIHISSNEIYLLENSKEILDLALKYIYLCDLDSYKELFDEVDEVKNNQYADVIRIGYYLMTNDNSKAKKIIDDNTKLMSSMDNYYIKAFSLFYGECLLNYHKYDEANKMLTSIESTTFNSKIFNMLVKDFSFRLYQEEKRRILAAKLYHELIVYYSENAHLKRIVSTQLTFIRMLFHDEEYEEVVKTGINSTVTNGLENNDEYNYIIGKSLIETKKEQQAKEYLDKISKDSKYRYIGVKELYLVSDDKSKFIEEIIKENTLKPNFYYSYFIACIYKSVDRSLFETEQYDNAYDNADQNEKIFLLKLEKEYLTSVNKYKEANIISGKIIGLSNGSKK